jgi:hypothetical protein
LDLPNRDFDAKPIGRTVILRADIRRGKGTVMRKQAIENAAYEVATQVRAVEDTIDAALAEIAELQARIMRANSVARVGFATAHPVLEELAEAVKGLVGARGSVVGCHSALAEAKTQIPGLRTVSFGEGEECPKKTAFTDLRIVA